MLIFVFVVMICFNDCCIVYLRIVDLISLFGDCLYTLTEVWLCVGFLLGTYDGLELICIYCLYLLGLLVAIGCYWSDSMDLLFADCFGLYFAFWLLFACYFDF